MIGTILDLISAIVILFAAYYAWKLYRLLESRELLIILLLTFTGAGLGFLRLYEELDHLNTLVFDLWLVIFYILLFLSIYLIYKVVEQVCDERLGRRHE